MTQIKLTPTVTHIKGLSSRTKHLPPRVLINNDTLCVSVETIDGDSIELEVKVEVLK